MLILIISLISIFSCDPADLQRTVGDVLGEEELTANEVAAGLKEALERGVNEGVDRLSQVNGYLESPYKILLPEDVKTITGKLKAVPGFADVEENLIEKINRSAEDAASSATPIFVSAIKDMSFEDAMDILMGEKNAATQYLRKKTYDQLYAAFNPVIVNSLNKTGTLDYYESIVTTYNKLPFVKKMNPDLDDYVTHEALDGLFSMIAKEELAIRQNPEKRVTDLLKRVFAKQD